MDMIVYSLVQSQRATAVVVTECDWGKTECACFLDPHCSWCEKSGTLASSILKPGNCLTYLYITLNCKSCDPKYFLCAEKSKRYFLFIL